MLDLGQLRKLVTELNTGDKSSRQEAVRALKPHEGQEWAAVPPEVIGPLVEALRDQLSENGKAEGVIFPPGFRQEVATILGNIGPRSESAIPQLAGLLEANQSHFVREAAATALGKIGKKAKVAVNELIEVLQPDCRGTLAARVARALGDIGCADDRVCSALVNLWRFSGESLKSQVAVALCQLRCDPPGLLATLSSILVDHRDVSLRKSAAEALEWRGKDELGVVPAFAGALNDEDEEVRRLAASALRRMHLSQEKALQVCCQQLKDTPCAETALRKSGQAAVPALIQALGAEDPSIRERAAKTLSAIGEAAKEAAPALSKALQDKDLNVRLAVAKAVWHITNEAEEVVPALAGLLKGKWSHAPDAVELRRRFFQGVIESLGRIGPPAKAAVPTLLDKTKDENRHVRESAIRAVQQIDPEAAAKAGLPH